MNLKIILETTFSFISHVLALIVNSGYVTVL